MRLRMTYPDQRAETPSALVIRSGYGGAPVFFIAVAAFFALMAWAANGPTS